MLGVGRVHKIFQTIGFKKLRIVDSIESKFEVEEENDEE
jgi:hypothetical protein